MPSVKPAVVQLKVPKNQKLYNSFVIIFSEKTCSAENEKFLLVFYYRLLRFKKNLPATTF